MNDKAREVLVAAALRGHKQAAQLHRLHEEADCAIGLLHTAIHGSRLAAVECWHHRSDAGCIIRTQHHFGISEAEGREIRDRNDAGDDFLTIARKVGREDEA